MTDQILYCRDCGADVKLRSGENGIHAVCECNSVPLVTRHGWLSPDWKHYTPLTEEGSD